MNSITTILYIILLLVLAVATFVEQQYGTSFVEENIYHSLWFCCMWAALSVIVLVAMLKHRLCRLLPMLLHSSFLVILVGAMLTFLFSQKGSMHLVVGKSVDTFTEFDSQETVKLPFSLCLDSFVVEHYPGTDTPSDFVSYIHGGTTISMNNILLRDGFRFYQSSFDDDMRGSIITVNHDPLGISVTYIGYIMLAISMIAMLLDPKGEFRRLLKNPLLKRGTIFMIFLLCNVAFLQANNRTLPALALPQADSLASHQVIYNGRVAPFNTLARDFVTKLSGKPTYCGMTPEQVVGGWLLRPDIWKNEPMIYIKNRELRNRLNIKTQYARLTDLFDGDAYKLQNMWKGTTDGLKMSPLDKAIIEVDEKVGLILMLENGSLIKPLPDDGSVKPLSSAKIGAELLYNKIPFTKLIFMFNLTIGLFAFFALLYQGMHHSSNGAVRYGRMNKLLSSFFILALFMSALFHLFGYSLRWYIAGRIPLSNGYETMQFMALCILIISIYFYRRFSFILPFGLLFSGFAMLVSYLGEMNPQITPLMPVLVSPLLSMHVSLIMMSYALFAFILFNGILALSIPSKAEGLMLLSRLILYPATFFLGIGIFLGAIWANVSWGSYWSWDPKEVWALITFMVYGVAFHSRSLRLFQSPKFFHWYMIFAFLTILMTYFGVNYILGGMHSYAN